MRQLLMERYRERLGGVLSCYDRIIVSGMLPGACYAKGMMGFLSRGRSGSSTIRDLPNRFVIACASALPNWPVRLASPSNTLSRSTFARKTSSPRYLRCAATIPAWSISSRQCKPATPTSPGTTNRRIALLRPDTGKCLHYYFYFARDAGALLSVRGGGHNIAGSAVCDGGVMIDLSPMKSVRIDPFAHAARVEPGVTLGEFDREAQAFGLVTPTGINSTTGIAGLTLGGGFGWTSRKFGLTADNLIGRCQGRQGHAARLA